MSTFENVTVIKQANIYFDGKVSSRTLQFADGTEKTLGFMLPGEYTFSTAAKELMEIMAGELEILLEGSGAWQSISAGESFEVAADSKFDIKIKTPTDYCCSYFK
ncbi:MAG: DUF1255 family protein [Methyloprofundus sp.]|nr:DUF1255 family protein [Methyloprofundus sp.]